MGKVSDPEAWEYSLGDEYDTAFFPLLSLPLLLSLGDADAEALEGEPIEPPAYTLGELTSLSKEGKDAEGKGVNLDCLAPPPPPPPPPPPAPAPAAAAAEAGWNPSQPVVPSAGKYITGVVAPDLLPPPLAEAAAAAQPPFPNPATLLRLLPPPPPAPALPAPDPKDASDVGRLVVLSSEVRGTWWW